MIESLAPGSCSFECKEDPFGACETGGWSRLRNEEVFEDNLAVQSLCDCASVGDALRVEHRRCG